MTPMREHRGMDAATEREHTIFLFQRTLDVVVWAISLHKPPTHQQIMERWGVHKSTAWRWLEPLGDVHAKFKARGSIPCACRTPAAGAPLRAPQGVEGGASPA